MPRAAWGRSSVPGGLPEELLPQRGSVDVTASGLTSLSSRVRTRKAFALLNPYYIVSTPWNCCLNCPACLLFFGGVVVAKMWIIF